MASEDSSSSINTDVCEQKQVWAITASGVCERNSSDRILRRGRVTAETESLDNISVTLIPLHLSVT